MKRPLFNLYLRRLRARLPGDLRVVVSFVAGLEKAEGDDAFTTRTDKSYLIRIDASASDAYAAVLLVHEWAHVLAKPWSDPEHHSDAWGLKSAKCWRVAVENKRG